MTATRRLLGRAELDAHPFPAAVCDAVFAAVLVDDSVDGTLVLPDAVPFDHDAAVLADCFRLCRQLWIEGFDRAALRDITATLLRLHDPDEAARLRFKHIRAKFKHVRYAHALYGAAHRYPPKLDRITITMGQAQDAWRNRRRIVAALRATQLRLLLARLPLARLRAEGDRLAPTTTAGFHALMTADYARLAALIAAPTVTGHAFHAARKVVGRQVSFWNTLGTLHPTPDRHRLQRWLSAINGSMGALHDRLVERRGTDRASYGAAFVLPGDIRDRIATLIRIADQSGGTGSGVTGTAGTAA